MLKLLSLTIDRKYDYSDRGEGALRAKVKLVDPDTGAGLDVALSPETIARIINLVGAEVQRNATALAKDVGSGMKASAVIEAPDHPRAIGNDG